MNDRDIAAAAEIVTGNAFRALRQQAKGLRRQAQRIKRLRARVEELEALLNAEWYGYQQCNADLLKAEAEAERGRADTRRLDFLEGHMIEIRFGAWTIRGTETRLVIDQLMASAQARATDGAR